MGLRHKYRLQLLLEIAEISKISYFWCLYKKDKPDKYSKIKEKIKDIHKNDKALGYRRIEIILRKQGTKINHKTVLKLMKNMGIKGKTIKKKYNFFRGTTGEVAPDIINRNFVATNPYEKLTTDVTQFNILGQKVYLSPILDMYNREIISSDISKSPNFKQIISMLKKMVVKLPINVAPILHSDQGWQYSMDNYQKILKSHNITQSMSRKGNCLDNSIMESFFGRLKVEMFYGEKFASVNDFVDKLKKFLDYYNSNRVSVKLDGLSPIEYREQYFSEFN